MQGGVHGWESMGRLLLPGTCAKITHIELRIEHRAPRLLPARCDADAWPCLDFQALGRRRGHDDPCVDGGSAMYGIRIVCRALQERTRPNRHPGYGKPAPDIATKSSDEICVDQGGAAVGPRWAPEKFLLKWLGTSLCPCLDAPDIYSQRLWNLAELSTAP